MDGVRRLPAGPAGPRKSNYGPLVTYPTRQQPGGSGRGRVAVPIRSRVARVLLPCGWGPSARAGGKRETQCVVRVIGVRHQRVYENRAKDQDQHVSGTRACPSDDQKTTWTDLRPDRFTRPVSVVCARRESFAQRTRTNCAKRVMGRSSLLQLLLRSSRDLNGVLPGLHPCPRAPSARIAR